MNKHTTIYSPKPIEYGLCRCGCEQKTNLAPRNDKKYDWIKDEPVRFIQGHWARVRPIKSPGEKLSENVNKNGSGGCWTWTGHKSKDGYGKIRVDGKLQLTHRVAWELENDLIPDGMLICHHCDNPACIRVSHLFLGTQQDNMDDMMRKGRNGLTGAKGEKHGNAKLTERDIPCIRSLSAEGIAQREIGELYGVGQTAIWKIVNRKTWKHAK